MRNIFLIFSHYTKCVLETSFRTSFWKTKIEHISESIVLSFIQFVFIICQVEGDWNVLKRNCKPLALTSYIKLFYKIKRCLELLSLPHFVHDFWRKIFVTLYSISWPNFIAWFPSWDIGQNLYCNCLLTRLWRHKFWNQP